MTGPVPTVATVFPRSEPFVGCCLELIGQPGGEVVIGRLAVGRGVLAERRGDPASLADEDQSARRVGQYRPASNALKVIAGAPKGRAIPPRAAGCSHEEGNAGDERPQSGVVVTLG